jgi:hypothetical protein
MYFLQVLGMICLLLYILSIDMFIYTAIADCHYFEPGAIIEDIRRLPVYDTGSGCEFHIAWRPLHTPWYSFSTSRSYFADPVRRTIRMACPPDGAKEDPSEKSLLEGCYPNTLRVDARHPPEFFLGTYSKVPPFGDIRFFRASAYILASPVIAIVVIVAGTVIVHAVSNIALNTIVHMCWLKSVWDRRRFHKLTGEMSQRSGKRSTAFNDVEHFTLSDAM